MSRFKAKRLCVAAYKKLQKDKNLPPYQRKELEEQILDLKASLQNRSLGYRKKARDLSRTLQRMMPIPFWKKWSAEIIGFAGLLLLAIVLRSMLLEFYKVPSGSMRPTLKEQDIMLADKANFGVNIPFINEHFLFNEDLVRRLGITLFSGQGLDITNNTMMYFFIFPGIKQYIKRLVAKPGDTLYFYGGKIYGIDKNDEPIVALYNSEIADQLTWIPYIQMDGKKKILDLNKGSPQVGFFQMNQPMLKASVASNGLVMSEFFNGNCWAMNFPTPYGDKRERPTQYRDMWGLGNYAVVRLITDQEKQAIYKDNRRIADHELFLEVFSIPSITQSSWEIIEGKIPVLKPNTSFIPLSQEHLDRLMKNMYTARFVVDQKRAYRYDLFAPKGYQAHAGGIPMEELEDGIYEFDKGVCYQIHSMGRREAVPRTHAIYSSRRGNVYRLFNFGITFSHKVGTTQRYSFYNKGDLFALNGLLLKKEDPYLQSYVTEQISLTSKEGYRTDIYPFVDLGPPEKEGVLDRAFIKKFGLKVPERSYLMLGDNYAMSGDTREFGFVPEGNLRGTMTLLVWPTSSFGVPLQVSYPWFSYPKLLIWAIVLTVYLLYRRVRSIRLKKDLSAIKRPEKGPSDPPKGE